MVQNIQNMIQTKIEKVKEQINTLQHYLNVKIETQDWHAVADVSMDIRELNAEWKAFLTVIEKIEELENEPIKEKKNEENDKSCDQCRNVIGITACKCNRLPMGDGDKKD